MRPFRQYYLGAILRPSRTFTVLLEDPHKLKFGVMALCINAVLYTLVYVNLTIAGGAPSSFTPFLAIPKEHYYFYNQFMLAPSMFLCWILAGGVVQLMSRFFGGKGTFEDTLSLLGFSISIACLASLLHDLPDTSLGALGIIDLSEYEVALNSPTIWRAILWFLYSSSFIWFIVLFSKAVRVAQRINSWPAFFVGFFAFLVYQSVFLVFNR